MSTSPFNAAGFGIPAFDPAQFERFGRQWFAAMSPQQPAAPDPFAWWKPAAPAAPQAIDPTVLAQQWMAQMQQVAAQFSGGAAQPADIAAAWRSMLGDNPLAQASAAGAFMPASFMPPGMGGGARGPLDMPAFGFTREHQERAQALAKAGAEFQQASQAFNAVIAEAGQAAFARFESLLAKRGSDHKPVDTARGLFDLWIDAAEDAYADVATGERFQKAFGDFVNAQMRVRAAMQQEMELAGAQMGIPGRSEVDAAHRKIAGLERDVARLRSAVDALTPRAAPQATAGKPAPKPGSSRQQAPGRSAPKTAAAKPATSKPPASKPAKSKPAASKARASETPIRKADKR
ncbi:class III poly(R)-hydroxyalkanoic acid synthase subunit PhaE [Cognatilysobacter lacus]|uniref:Poly(3-hydroxyalkanoate) polymerase subunit PhaE n=1 Tax=Cognatilysobacter lacus TaxID=1643323 RepID=A0A5D8ZAD0_9GAMM|nr:class III poly(R)-hydroxyalkanoic acid synthase subunit PhaE [Lysobacter lacus]TZF91868.1 class III poly(R)-hydroxyalkanoic acid synthase subunit PhaE [Lysobacter lacus]